MTEPRSWTLTVTTCNVCPHYDGTGFCDKHEPFAEYVAYETFTDIPVPVWCPMLPTPQTTGEADQ